MLSEQQIAAMLTACETACGQPLTGLRKRLLAHEDYASSLWELVTTYACVNAKLSITPEPGQAQPDIFVAGNGRLEPFAIEVTTVSPRSKDPTDDLRKFHGWIIKEATTSRFPSGAEIFIEAADREKGDPALPPENQWRALRKSSEGQNFFSQIAEIGKASWINLEFNFVVHFHQTSNTTVSGSYPVIGGPKTIREHPVYRAIKKKAEQARIKWNDEIRSHPIVLVIGAGEQSSEFSYGGSGGTVGLEHAINSALLDAHELDLIDRFNHLGNRYIERVKSDRPAGARWITGVLFVNLITNHGTYPGQFKRCTKAKYFTNIHAERSLSTHQKHALAKLDFNCVEYGPGWEAWEAQTIIESRRRTGGLITMGTDQDGDEYIEFPSVMLLRILAGDLDANEAFGGRNSGFLRRFQNALFENRELKHVTISNAEGVERKEQSVRIVLSDPRQLVIAGKRK